MARPNGILLSKAAFSELPSHERLRCRTRPLLALPGVAGRVEVFDFEWRDVLRFPTRVRIEETGEEIALPDQPTITFGRLRLMDGAPANDIVLTLPDFERTQLISRWHFELRREPTGFVLRSVSNQLTEVNGVPVAKGQERPITVGSAVTLSRVMTLRFLSSESGHADDTVSIMIPVPPGP
jgi:hypothetical protein